MAIFQSPQSRNLYRFDPIAYFLIAKLKLSYLNFGFWAIALGSGVYLLTAWISNTLWTKPNQTGLLEDWFPWIWVLFIVPIVLGYYLWSFEAIDRVIQDLETSDVIETADSEVAEMNRIVLSGYRPKWRRLLAFANAVLFSFFVFNTRSGLKNSWTSSHPLPSLVVTIATLFVVYMGSMLVLNLIANIWILHCILKQELDRKTFNVNPLHPDRCGGLRSLSDYALKTAYLAAVLGVMVGFIAYQFLSRESAQSNWVIQLIIPIYILLAITCFFGPLVAAHRGMKKAKEELLGDISRQFQADYTQTHASLASDAEVLKKGAEKIKELRAFYTLTDEFPVWPFDVQTFRRFLLTLPAPLLPLLLGVLQKLLKVLLKQWGIDLG